VSGGYLEASTIRVLVVDDYEPFRRFVCSTLSKRWDLRVIGEASDGLEAVRKAEELKPDLIVLDIGLPTLNGIEAARRIHKPCPECKILFMSQESSAGVAQEAFSLGALGYIVKAHAGSELLVAVEAVCQGRRFVSRGLSGHSFTDATDPQASRFRTQAGSPIAGTEKKEIARNHEVGFFSDDAGLLDDLTRFIEAALKAGNAAIVVATESRRDSLLLRLQAQGLDIAAAIEQGRYIALDAADALAKFMLHGVPDPVRFLYVLGNLISTAAKTVKGKQARVAIFGEMCHLLLAQGNAEAAIQVEKLGTQLAETYDADILCGYYVRNVQGEMESHIFQRICAEHSAVYSR
jgi:DNA-binding NarL/FixJ family response regulator